VAICSTPLRAADGVSNDKIIFGQVAALNGPAQALGQGMREGILAAFEDANRAGGVNGRKLELKSIDDSYEPEKTIIATNNAIMEERVFALVGAVGTPTSKAGQPIATAAKVPFIGPFTGAGFDMALVALECALVAAGLLEVARFSSPNIWDVAAGIALVRAGGGVVREHDGMHWAPMQRFAPVSRADEKPDLRAWRRPIVVGTKKGVETMCGEMTTHAP
jgi:Periplasmic binding protein/Inositol monophosphatase family